MAGDWHESFWVVVGTAAPVLALAQIVTIGQSHDADDLLIDRSGQSDLSIWQWLKSMTSRRSYTVIDALLATATGAFFLSTVLTWLAVTSLAQRRDHAHPQDVADWLTVLMGSLVVTTALGHAVKQKVAKGEKVHLPDV